MRPHCIFVDTENPDNNREFEVHHVQGLHSSNGAFTFDGFAISVVVPVPDAHDWDAQVVHVPGYAQRAVLIKGASGVFFLRDNSMVEQFAKKTDERIAEAVRAHALAMKDLGADRKCEYWLLVFPRESKLDWQLLAKNTTKAGYLKKHLCGLEGTDPISTKKMVGLRLTFTIGKIGKGRQIKEVGSQEEIDW